MLGHHAAGAELSSRPAADRLTGKLAIMGPGPLSRPRPELGPSGVTEAVAARYREILPSVFRVETNGPLLSMSYPVEPQLGLSQAR